MGDGAVTVADPSDLAPGGLVVAIAMLGAPAITAELLFEGTEFVRALRGLERHLHDRAVAVMGLETAGVNVFPPLVVAAALRLPLLDLDGMGRAFPRLEQTVLHARGAHGGPMVGAGVTGELVAFDVTDAARAEALARGCLAALGGWAAHACYPMTVAAAAERALHGSLARARWLGEALGAAANAEDLAARIDARLLGAGRVIAVDRDEGATAAGNVLIEPTDRPGSTLRLDAQTEYLLATVDGEPVAATPDLIVVVAAHGLSPIACDEIRRGDDVAVLLLAADPAWHEAACLALAGPAAFGYAVTAARV